MIHLFYHFSRLVNIEAIREYLLIFMENSYYYLHIKGKNIIQRWPGKNERKKKINIDEKKKWRVRKKQTECKHLSVGELLTHASMLKLLVVERISSNLTLFFRCSVTSSEPSRLIRRVACSPTGSLWKYVISRRENVIRLASHILLFLLLLFFQNN